MFASEIEMLAGATGDNSVGVSAMTLSGSKGIWLGSNKGIRLFSGTDTLNGESASNANIELVPTHLLLGVSNTNGGTAIKMDTEAITLAAGSNAVENIENNGISGVTGSLTGVQITKDFFGIAMNSSNVMNAIIMNSNGITLGSGVGAISDLGGDLTNATGSYVRISGKGITLNSSATLNVSTNNCIIDSTATGNQVLFRLGGNESPALQYTPNGGLAVTGQITATTLTLSGGATINGLTSIAGWTIGTNSLSSGAVSLNSSGDYSINCNDNFLVTPTGDVYLKSLKIRNAADTGYETVNFATAFNRAVTLWGEWGSVSNGDSESSAIFTVYAQFYKSTALETS